MVRSLTKSHENLLQEQEKIESQIKELESKLGNGIVTLIKQNNGFKVPYPILCGAILETLQRIESDNQKHDQWKEQGERFLRSISPASKKENKKDATRAA